MILQELQKEYPWLRPHVIRLARYYNCDISDAISAALEGIAKGLLKYDPTRGASLETFLRLKIQSEIRMESRSLKRYNKISKAYRPTKDYTEIPTPIMNMKFLNSNQKDKINLIAQGYTIQDIADNHCTSHANVWHTLKKTFNKIKDKIDEEVYV